MQVIKNLLISSIKDLFGVDIELQVSRTDEQFGDVATNVALQLAPKLGRSPADIAKSLAERLASEPSLSKVEVAGPGFINISFSDETIWGYVCKANEQKNSFGRHESLAGKTVVAEYSDPNPFKILHAGHLYTSIVGDSLANLLEALGAEVHRVHFGGDVGLPVGTPMWSSIDTFGSSHHQGV